MSDRINKKVYKRFLKVETKKRTRRKEEYCGEGEVYMERCRGQEKHLRKKREKN